jgi:hypothetical protein
VKSESMRSLVGGGGFNHAALSNAILPHPFILPKLSLSNRRAFS